MVYDNAKLLENSLKGLTNFREALALIESVYCEFPLFSMRDGIIELMEDLIRIMVRTVRNCQLREKGGIEGCSHKTTFPKGLGIESGAR